METIPEGPAPLAMRDPAIEGPFLRFARQDRHQWPGASCISTGDDLSKETAIRPAEMAAHSSWMGVPVAEIGDTSPRPLIQLSDLLRGSCGRLPYPSIGLQGVGHQE